MGGESRVIHSPSHYNRPRSAELMIASRPRATSWSDRDAREYATLLDLANDAIIAMNRDAFITFWNRGAERLYGWTRAEAVGRKAHELLRTEFPGSLDDVIDEVRLTGQWRGRLIHTSRDGHRVVVASRWTARYDNNGRWIGSFEINRDITEQTRAEEALRESEQRFQLAERAANAWTWEYDLVTGEMRRSREPEEVFGVSPGTMRARTMSDVLSCIHPDDRERVRQALAQGLGDRQVHEVEYRVLLPDGSIRWLLSRGRVFESAGEAPRVFGIAVDITSRKHAEETARSTERLTTLGRLAAAIAHEINSPLDAIGGMLHLIATGARPGEAPQLAQLSLAEVARISQIVRATLGLARTAKEFSRIDLRELVEGVLSLHGARIRSLSVRISKSYRGDPAVVAVPGEIRQVVANLLGNALDAVGSGGTIAISIRRRTSAGRHGVSVAIADNGPGIPQDVRRRLFESFITTKGEQGTGLGLWVARQIVAAHGGSIRVRTCSRADTSGTVFSVFLPATPPADRAPAS